jgi:capsular polysaccharide biosynthesis protein
LWVSRSKDSQIINVYFDGASPEASIEILDAIVSAFAEYSTERDHARKDGGRV